MSFTKSPPWRSEAFLGSVRAEPCMGCGAPPPSDAHHCAHPSADRRITRHGTGQKHSDQFAVPLCRICHESWHRRRELRGMNIEQSNEAVAVRQVELLAAWIERETAMSELAEGSITKERERIGDWVAARAEDLVSGEEDERIAAQLADALWAIAGAIRSGEYIE